jgi:hypothetical protein
MSSSSMSLLSLPVEMLRYVLRYLQQKDIAALDIASTNRSDRESFLLALDRSEFRSLCSRHKENLDCEIRWFLSRGVTISSLTLSDRHGELHDHPCLPELIRKSQAKLSEIDFTCLDLSSSSSNNDNYNKHELMSALGTCNNLHSCRMTICEILASDFISCLRNKQSLRVLSLSSIFGLSSSSIRAIATQCPNLERLVLSTVSVVSDQELNAIINGCRKLERLHLIEVNITDQSMRLLVETNRDKEIVRWDAIHLFRSVQSPADTPWKEVRG